MTGLPVCPVIASEREHGETGDAFELARVGRSNLETVSQRGGGDPQVVRSDDFAPLG